MRRKGVGIIGNGSLRLLFAAVIVIILSFVASQSSLAAEPLIQGTVLNKTGGASPVKSQKVEMKVTKFDGSMESLGNTRTDDLGTFTFANVADTSALTYTVSTTFQGVEYQTVVTSPLTTSSAAKPELAVYETTNKANLDVELSHIVIGVDSTTGDLHLMEIAMVSNNSDKTLVSSSSDKSRTSRTLWFPLPKEALYPITNEGLDDVAGTSVTLDGLGYSGPVLPGQRQVIYQYELANPGRSFTISKPLAYPTRKVNILMADVGEKIAGPRLVAGDPVTFNNQTYLRLVGEAFKASDGLQFSVSDFPAPGSRAAGLGSSDELKWIVLALVILTGGTLILVYPRIRSARRER